MLAPANAAETEVVWELEPPGGSVGVGDHNDWSPSLMERTSGTGAAGVLRKILSPSVAAWVNERRGHCPLDFACLVTE